MELCFSLINSQNVRGTMRELLGFLERCVPILVMYNGFALADLSYCMFCCSFIKFIANETFLF